MDKIRSNQFDITKQTDVNRVAQQKQLEDRGTRESEKLQSEKQSLTISDQAKQFKNARVALDNLPDIREDKVNQIQNQIQTNNYNVPGEKVAEKMLKSFGI
jgi:negative regulator of flagellin synthesis FlgM